MLPQYTRWLRDRVGHDRVQLNFAVACIRDGERLLLQRRGDDDSGWGFLGGAIELGESAEEAVIREVHEESGLVVRVDGLLGVYTKYEHTYSNGDLAQPMSIVFECTPVGGELCVDGEETVELRYFAAGSAPDLFCRQHRDILSDIAAGRTGVFR